MEKIDSIEYRIEALKKLTTHLRKEIKKEYPELIENDLDFLLEMLKNELTKEFRELRIQ